MSIFFFFQAEDGIRDVAVTGVQTCALPISAHRLIRRQPSRREASRVASVTTSTLTSSVIQYKLRTATMAARSEEHTSELQSRLHLVCRLLLEKKKNTHTAPLGSPHDILSLSLRA